MEDGSHDILCIFRQAMALLSVTGPRISLIASISKLIYSVIPYSP
jgi:hypothetical protein